MIKQSLAKTLTVFVCSITIMAFIPGKQVNNKPIYLNTAYSFRERAADLVSRMTLEEKMSQLGNTMPAIPRLGVNKYDVWGEALHGVMGRNNNSGMTATSFPNSVAAGCTWDPELIKKETTVIADEARGFNHDLIFTLTYWSPVVEPARDPRWGRTAETFGEDPFLVSQISAGFIEGIMGNDPTYLKAVPCGKHFIANNTEYNRHTGSANMDARDLREFYLTPYKALIEKNNLPAIMTAYGAVNGTPMSANEFLVDSIIRRTYGMDGYITGDCGAISDMIRGHNYAKDGAAATALGLTVGVDTDCGSVYQVSAVEALKKGLIAEAVIDRALINIFTIRMRLGEFDPQSIVPFAGIRSNIINNPAHNDLAMEIATKTPVLLKNNVASTTKQKALPLDPAVIKKIAVFGPMANKIELGDYSGSVEASLESTPLLGLQQYIKKHGLAVEILNGAGGNTERKNDFYSLNGFATITKDGKAKDYDITKYDNSSKGLITEPRFGRVSLRGIKNGDWIAYGNINLGELDSIRFNMSVTYDGGVIEARVGSATGNIIASQKVMSGPQPAGGNRFFGSAVTVTAKINTLGITGAQEVFLVFKEPEAPATDKETLDMARSADAAIIFVGTDQTTGREESDRFSLTLPGNQEALIKAVAAVNPNTIVVMQTMGMVEVESFKNNTNIPGIIFTGYNGQAQGAAMAKILFGEVNPGGKSTLTWYKSVNDLPDFNDYTLRSGAGKNGRTYWYFNKEVSYEFGYGLSYTDFAYSNFSIDKKAITPNGTVVVTADVKNTGKVDGDEIVQIYMKTPGSAAALQRPIKRLKGFKRVTIPAGQTIKVTIPIDCADLWFWDAKNNKITFDQGNYIFEIGASSKDIRGQVSAVMSGTFNPVLKTVVAGTDKIVLQMGNTAATRVTASLSDDSFLDLRKGTVIYKSNNNAVATVDAKGNITAKNPGVATISAEVTYGGKTVINGYPVKVMPNLSPATITVDGKAITGFNSAARAYSYLLTSTSALPVIKATATDKNAGVEIEQVKAIPGTAIINYVDYNTNEKNSYYINFDVASASDEFNTSTVGPQWQWVRENTAAHTLSAKQGALTITTEPGDVSEGSNNARNMLLQSANNDWTIETKLVCSRTPAQPENAGIIVYQDDNNFLKLMFRAVIKTRRQTGVQPGTIDLLLEENGIAKSMKWVDIKDEVTGNKDLYLKLEKKGSIYQAYYSWDGTKYEMLATADIMLKDIKAGLIACDGVVTQSMTSTFYFDKSTNKPNTPFNVSFDYFRISNSGLK